MQWIEDLKKRFSLSLFDIVLVGLMVLGGALVLWGLLGNMGDKGDEIEYLAGDLNSNEMIWVDVAGAVERPGVYELGKGSRVKDALVAAGGLAQDADRSYLEKVLNLAEIVKDGEKLYIPHEGSEVMGESTGLININTANISELDPLWGVGTARAQDIVDNRPFSKVEELTTKNVLPENVYEQIKNEVSVY